jgi:hypothetical protein
VVKCGVDNLRSGRAIRGISGTLRREWWGECCGYSEVFYVVAPPASVKDWGVGTREQVLNVPIACRWYGPGKPSSLLSTTAWLKHTASMVVLGEKLRRVPWTTQPGWVVESGALFLGRSASVQPCGWLVKGCHVWGPPAGSVRRTYVDLRWKRTCHVGRVFPCRVYIDSNHRDSRIWVTACSWLPSMSTSFALITCLQLLLD